MFSRLRCGHCGSDLRGEAHSGVAFRGKPGVSSRRSSHSSPLEERVLATYVLCEALALFGLIQRFMGFNFSRACYIYIAGFVLLFFLDRESLSALDVAACQTALLQILLVVVSAGKNVTAGTICVAIGLE